MFFDIRDSSRSLHSQQQVPKLGSSEAEAILVVTLSSHTAQAGILLLRVGQLSINIIILTCSIELFLLHPRLN